MFDVLKYLLCAAWCTFCNNDQRLRVPHQDLEEKIHYIYIVLNEHRRYYRHSASMS